MVSAMGFSSLVSLIICYVFISMRITTAQRCYSTGNFTANSTYSKNRDTIIASLASNAAANGGFYNTTVGQGPDTIYALAMCRGDASPTDCSSCVNSTAQDLISNCPLQYEAIAWGGDPPCIVHYANRSFFGVLELSPREAGASTGQISWNTSGFHQIWAGLMEKVVKQAAAGSSRLKYATGAAYSSYFQRIYALVQCTPDLSQSDCDWCLRQNVADFENFGYDSQGGFVSRPSCIYRWDLYPFYTEVADAPPPSPVPSPSPPPLPPSPPTIGDGGISLQTVIIIVVPAVLLVALAALTLILCQRRSRRRKRTQLVQRDSDSLQLDFETIRDATDNFSDNKKLGEGGFGAVYKGTLPNGEEIAVKRLSRNSDQGQLEFMNEVKLMAKLQHRNLVRLIGFSLKQEERLLIYEFLPNSSLNYFIFNPEKQRQLDWPRRYKIIAGIARGLLYLHEDSRLRIVHRDLKASNILLTKDMNPKISDFGMARIFKMEQSQENTSRVAGTYGYISPEYAMHGQFSVKSDVFSFGVLMLEIISGKKNSDFHQSDYDQNLLSYAWRLWRDGKALEFIDPALRDSYTSEEVIRCIHIGLLCVEEDPVDRLTMTTVVLTLNSLSVTLSLPKQPVFYLHSRTGLSVPEIGTKSYQPPRKSLSASLNEVSITELSPR